MYLPIAKRSRRVNRKRCNRLKAALKGKNRRRRNSLKK
jgi:hypothetical protein